MDDLIPDYDRQLDQPYQTEMDQRAETIETKSVCPSCQLSKELCHSCGYCSDLSCHWRCRDRDFDSELPGQEIIKDLAAKLAFAVRSKKKGREAA